MNLLQTFRTGLIFLRQSKKKKKNTDEFSCVCKICVNPFITAKHIY